MTYSIVELAVDRSVRFGVPVTVEVDDVEDAVGEVKLLSKGSPFFLIQQRGDVAVSAEGTGQDFLGRPFTLEIRRK